MQAAPQEPVLQIPLQARGRDPDLGRAGQPACGRPHAVNRTVTVSHVGTNVPAVAEVPACGDDRGRVVSAAVDSRGLPGQQWPASAAASRMVQIVII